MCQNIVEFLKQEQNMLKKLLEHFDGKMSDEIPNKTQRLNINSSVEPQRSMRLSMRLRYDLINSLRELYFRDSAEKIGIDQVLLNNVGEILNHN